MQKYWGMFVGLSAMAGLVSGCDDGSPRANQCQRICEKRELCDSATDEMDCVDDCLAQTHLSGTYMAEWAECVVPNSVSCDAAMDEVVVEDCISDTLRAQPPGELLLEVCQALASKLAACEAADALQVRNRCERGDALQLSDPFLEQSRVCVDDLCEELPGCFDDLSDDYDTDLSLLPEQYRHDREGEHEDSDEEEAHDHDGEEHDDALDGGVGTAG